VDSFLALADPNRRGMVELLAQGSRSAGEIAARFDISAPAVSQHLKALRESRLVQVEVRGQKRIYTLSPEGFCEIDDWMARHARFWINRLDRLGAAMAMAVSGGAPVGPAAAAPDAHSTPGRARSRSRRHATTTSPRTRTKSGDRKRKNS